MDTILTNNKDSYNKPITEYLVFKNFMKKLIIIFLAIFLFSCENNVEKISENPKEETEKVENIEQNSKKTEEDFLQALWGIDARTIGILQHNFESEKMIFMTISELYDALKKIW